MGFHKILKKHDKMLPAAPCRQFYIAHLHAQPWVQGNYSELMVRLSAAFSELRGDTLAEAEASSAQAFNRHTTKYWVRTADVSSVKRIIIECAEAMSGRPTSGRLCRCCCWGGGAPGVGGL